MVVKFYWLVISWLFCGHSLLALESHRTGDYIIENSVVELLGEVDSERFKAAMNINDPIKWQVYVPQSYNENIPAGVLVYISPTPSGVIPANWKSLMEKHNLIWIAANSSGNKIMAMHRMNFALLGANIIKSKYSTTSKRMYVSGFSGGG